MRTPKPQKYLRSKLDAMIPLVDLRGVFGDTYKDRTWWRAAMGNIALGQHAFRLAAPDAELDADAERNLSSRVAKLLNGSRPLAWEQLVNLAQYTRLDSYLGGIQEATRCLSDEVDFDEFLKRLFQSRWANPQFRERALYATRHLLLTAFERFPWGRDGIRVGPDTVVTQAPDGPRRGARLPRPEDRDTDLPSFPLETKLKIGLDINRPCELVLLEIHPAPERLCEYGVACLAPSPLVPVRALAPGLAVLPTRLYDGLAAFIIDQPLGRHDWLAILTAAPLATPWKIFEDAFYEPSEADLIALLDALSALNRDDVEIRHFPFRVIDRGAP